MRDAVVWLAYVHLKLDLVASIRISYTPFVIIMLNASNNCVLYLFYFVLIAKKRDTTMTVVFETRNGFANFELEKDYNGYTSVNKLRQYCLKETVQQHKAEAAKK